MDSIIWVADDIEFMSTTHGWTTQRLRMSFVVSETVFEHLIFSITRLSRPLRLISWSNLSVFDSGSQLDISFILDFNFVDA